MFRVEEMVNNSYRMMKEKEGRKAHCGCRYL